MTGDWHSKNNEIDHPTFWVYPSFNHVRKQKFIHGKCSRKYYFLRNTICWKTKFENFLWIQYCINQHNFLDLIKHHHFEFNRFIPVWFLNNLSRNSRLKHLIKLIRSNMMSKEKLMKLCRPSSVVIMITAVKTDGLVSQYFLLLGKRVSLQCFFRFT